MKVHRGVIIPSESGDGRCNPLQMAYLKPFQLFKQLKQSRLPYVFLGVDAGDSFTGFALSSSDLRLAYPLTTCYAKDPEELHNTVIKMVKDCNVGGCVVGYSPMADLSKEAAHYAMVFGWMKTVFGTGVLANFPFTFVNERYSSRDADKLLKGMFFKSQSDYEWARNRMAALVLTQNWLDSIHIENHLEELGEHWNRNHHQ